MSREGGHRLLLWLTLAAALGIIAFFYFRGIEETGEGPVLVPAESERAPLIRHPIPEPEPEAAGPGESETPSPLAGHLPESLPELDESDAVLPGLIEYLVRNPRLAELLVPKNVIRRFVITTDSLTGPAVPLNHLPVTAPTGRFMVLTRDDGATATIDERNYARYGRYVAMMDQLDSAEVARAYIHFYPLFQEAYRELGYPQGFFNDRLVAVIDHLLETPEVAGPLALEQPTVFYVYADPRLEALSAGQKLLLRMGPENAAALKRKLRELRQELVR